MPYISTSAWNSIILRLVYSHISFVYFSMSQEAAPHGSNHGSLPTLARRSPSEAGSSPARRLVHRSRIREGGSRIREGGSIRQQDAETGRRQDAKVRGEGISNIQGNCRDPWLLLLQQYDIFRPYQKNLSLRSF
jgi:hypothetical protein